MISVLSQIQKSKKQGASVAAFPDVCKTPTPGGPVPTPYPNITAGGSNATQQKVTQTAQRVGSGSAIPKSVGDEAGTLKGIVSMNVKTKAFMSGGAATTVAQSTAAKSTSAAVAHQMRSRLNQLNQQLTTLPGRNPDHWHMLVDEYVQVTAMLYVTLAESNM